MACVIVTGGAGFIGSNFVRLLLARNISPVVVLDCLTYAGNLCTLDGLVDGERCLFVEGDIADRETVEKVYREHRPTAVVNFAAESHVDRSIDGPEVFLRTNVTGTFRLIEAARGFTAELLPDERQRFRFLHVSTDEVYGSLGAEGAFREDTPYAPNSPYAAAKAAADHFVRAYYHTYGLPTLITNCSNNYGPFQHPEKLIPLTLLNALEGRTLPVYGDGANVRDWLFVEDHCEGILLVLEHGQAGEKYNIGASNERTNLETVDLICDLLEAELPAARNPRLSAVGVERYRDLVTFVADRPGHDRRYAIDSARIRSELGWRPANDFVSGMRKTVAWYLANPRWCEQVQARGYRRERLGLASEGESAGVTNGRAGRSG